jgi:ATP synthase F1 delta subunit
MSFSSRIVTTYAKALFQSGKNTTSEKEDELFKVAEITGSDQSKFFPDVFILGEELILLRSVITSSKVIKEYFKNPTYLEQEKLEILFNIFPGLSITMKAFLRVLTERSHLSLISQISEEYNHLLNKFKNVTKVKLIVASELDETFGPLLLANLKKVTNSNEIILLIAYNTKLLGGLVVEYNSVAIDASVLKEFSLFFTEI